MWAPYNKKKKLKSVAIKNQLKPKCACYWRNAYTFSKEEYISNNLLSCFFFVFLSVLSFSLFLSLPFSDHISNIHVFFLLYDSNTHALVLCSPLSVSIGLFSFLLHNSSSPGSLFHCLSHWLHPLTVSLSLSLSPLLQLLARLQCLTVTRLLFHLFSLFSPHIFSPLCLSKYVPLFRMTLSVQSCSWRACFVLVIQSWRI